MNILVLTTGCTDWSFIWLVTILGFALVLVLLFVFVYIMKGLGWIMRDHTPNQPTPAQSGSGKEQAVAHKPTTSLDAMETDMAAVAMALNLYYGVHDVNAPTITLQGRSSAWNNKAFGINNI